VSNDFSIFRTLKWENFGIVIVADLVGYLKLTHYNAEEMGCVVGAAGAS
jgi:hypothetical protein